MKREHPYNDYSSYLKERFGGRAYRIGLDAGLGCPNRDGTIGEGGCLYCNAGGSRATYTDPARTVHDQLAKRIAELTRTKNATRFIAYFQAFTNTYAPVPELKRLYATVRDFTGIVGLSIGTRPDAVDSEKLDLIASYRDRYDVWIEYGLQSIHDKTLQEIRRRHDLAAFLQAYQMTRERGIKTCVHVILGLPGETRDDMMATARKLTELKVDGAKIHLLHVLKGSALEKSFRKGEITLLEQDEYVSLVCDFLEHLSPEIVIQRLTGEGKGDEHIAPDWARDKLGTIEKIRNELRRRGSYQGIASGLRPSQ